MSNKCLFLDRDGVINQDFGYVNRIEDFDFVEGIFDLVLEANLKLFKVIIITNQAGIGRGYYTEFDFKKLTNWMQDEFEKRKCIIDDVYYCPHHPIHGIGKYLKDCPCRKPAPGMILKAQLEHNISLKHSVLIGDKQTDIEAGSRAGIGTSVHFDVSSTSCERNTIYSLSDAHAYLK
ncbi:MAG: HAD family hydrolase [Lentilitoribacter sp.]